MTFSSEIIKSASFLRIDKLCLMPQEKESSSRPLSFITYKDMIHSIISLYPFAMKHFYLEVCWLQVITVYTAEKSGK